jgi:glucose-6-phosphate isomerase
MQVLQEEATPLSVADLAQKAEASDRIEAVYKLVRHLQANKRGVVLEGNLAKPSSLMVSTS